MSGGCLAFAAVDDADANLLAGLRSGDEAAFAALVCRYQPRMLRLAESLVGSRAVAEEAVQDTWLGVVRGLERFEGRSSMKTWLFRILVNRARSAGVREHGDVALDDEPSVPAGDFDRDGGWATPPEVWAEAAEDRLFAERMAKLVVASLDRLPARQRQVVLLRDVEGLTSAEVCAVLGVTDGHHRVLLHRGRARLRRLLDAEMGGA